MVKMLVVANWKMNPQTSEEARELASKIELGLLGMNREKTETVICPPFVFLPVLQHLVHFALLGAQDVAAEESGPYTGEVSAYQILEFAAKYVIVGHSERRALGEKDDLVSKKVKIALKHKLHPILCVGWGAKKKFTNEEVKQVIKKQIQAALRDTQVPKASLTIAYEPVWAISKGLGTGKAVTAKHAAEIMEFIQRKYPHARVIYGGSLDAKNAHRFASEKIIKGGLVGGASLVVQEFLQVIRAFSHN